MSYPIQKYTNGKRQVEAVRWMSDIESHQMIEQLVGQELEEDECPDDLLVTTMMGIISVKMGYWVVKEGKDIYVLSNEFFEDNFISRSN